MTQSSAHRLKLEDRPSQEDARSGLIDSGLHPVLADCLSRRGITDAAALDPSLTLLPPPKSLRHAPEAAALLGQAIQAGERILVVGDYDADGATASALLLRGLLKLGARADFLVPDRFAFGYGLTVPLIDQTLAILPADKRPQWLVTVDNGISSIDGVRRAQALGMQVIVTDHHLPGQRLPDCLILNPQLPDCPFPSKQMAGVGVAFYLVMALRTWMVEDDNRRKAAGEPSWLGEDIPRIDDLLPLVALGTVADLVRLDDLNRRLVEQGLRRIRKGQAPPGLLALFQAAGCDPREATCTDLGYQIGPRLNAAGRLADMAVGIRCLTTDDPVIAQNLAQTLDALNRERRSLEGVARDEALEQAAAKIDLGLAGELPQGLVLYQDDWHQGLVGLLASRVKEQFHRPVVAFARESSQSDWLKGSARSIPGIHLRDVLERVDTQQPGLIKAFGGHAMAAGLSLHADHLAGFEAAFREALAAFAEPGMFERTLQTDGCLAPTDHRLELAQLLAGQIWGQGFGPPVFRNQFRVRSARRLKERHLKLQLSPASSPAHQFEAIWFDGPTSLPPEVELAYELSINHWQGMDSLQLLIRAQALN